MEAQGLEAEGLREVGMVPREQTKKLVHTVGSTGIKRRGPTERRLLLCDKRSAQLEPYRARGEGLGSTKDEQVGGERA